MTHVWWHCRTCGQELYDSRAVKDHREQTGHNSAAVLTEHVPTAGPGSTPAARAAAIEATKHAIRNAKEKGNRR